MSRYISFTKLKHLIFLNGGSRSLNEDKESNLITNHRSSRVKRFANYALKTGTEGVLFIKNIYLQALLFAIYRVPNEHLLIV
jgi:hypothetical protein